MASTLLLADGNPAIQRIVALTFAHEDIDVVCVNDGEQAMARIASDRPDIVLADVAMSKRSGYDVAAFVKDRPELAHIPVLLLAGALEPVDQARAAQVRCDGVLVKPFEPRQVVARVLELVRGGKGSPTQGMAGVPRPIDRLLEPRHPQPEPADRRDEPPQKVVKHPSVPMPVEAPVPVPPAASKPAAAVTGEFGDDPLADYFDKLDAAFDDIEPPRSMSSVSAAGLDHDTEQLDLTEQLDVPTLRSVLGEFDRPLARPLSPMHEPSPVFKDDILFASPPVEPPDIRPVPQAPRRDIPGFRAVTPPPVEKQAPPLVPVSEPEQALEPIFDLDLNALADPFSTLAAADPFDALAAVDRMERARVEEEERVAAAAAQPPAAQEPAAAEPAASELVVSEALIDAVAARVIQRLAPNGITDLVSLLVTEVAERLVREEIDRIRGRK